MKFPITLSSIKVKCSELKVKQYKEIPKFSESEQRFLNEAKIQQDIWIKTIENGSKEFTPSIANFVLFNNQNSHKLVGCLDEKLHSKTRVGADVPMMSVITYLVDILYKNQEYELGVITMPTINNNITLYKYIQINENNDELIHNAYSNAIASVIRLFLFYGVFHFDLNSSNILIIKDGPQMVTRRGEEAAVLVSIAEWRQLHHAARPSLKSLLLSELGRSAFDFPQRSLAKRRTPPNL